MSEREHGVREDHPRARPLHHVLDLFAHIRLVAMDLAEGTELFIDLEGALFQAEEGVFGECPALLAQLPFRSVFAVAIRAYHHGDELFFLLPRFELFLGFCCFHDPPLFAVREFAYTNSQAKIWYAAANSQTMQ